MLLEKRVAKDFTSYRCLFVCSLLCANVCNRNLLRNFGQLKRQGFRVVRPEAPHLGISLQLGACLSARLWSTDDDYVSGDTFRILGGYSWGAYGGTLTIVHIIGSNIGSTADRRRQINGCNRENPPRQTVSRRNSRDHGKTTLRALCGRRKKVTRKATITSDSVFSKASEHRSNKKAQKQSLGTP